MKNLFLASIFLFSVGVSQAGKLSQALKLPDYLDKNYGELDLRIKEGGTQATAEMIYTTKQVAGGGAHGPATVQREASALALTIPKGLTGVAKNEAISKALFDYLSKEDRQFRFALEDLDAMRVWNPAKGDHSINMLDRVKSVFVAKLSKTEISSKDEIAELWWKLKFEAEDTKHHDEKIKKGDPILMVLHQKGYFKKTGNFATDLRRKLDLGHSALGIRYAGEGPEKDLLLNPGSKNRQFYEAALPNSADPKIPNMVDTDNLWKWSETQITKRYMNVRAEILPLTKTQKEALPILVPKIRGVNIGPAVALTNNCADGASALVNFLMPIERTFSPKSLLGPSLPIKVVQRSGARFENSQSYKFPENPNKNPNPSTPDTSYKDQTFKREELTTFDNYLNFEKKMLSSQ
ncbi:MAG: hypothetical protein ABIR96_02715 [Bdellovibrionota bacterium]